MATREGSTQRWSFGIFEVDTRSSDLRRSGTPVKLREQSFRILVLLLERAGDIVTREELRQALWPSDTYVDFDRSLNTAIMKLRDALADSADKPSILRPSRSGATGSSLRSLHRRLRRTRSGAPNVILFRPRLRRQPTQSSFLRRRLKFHCHPPVGGVLHGLWVEHRPC